uniref:Uncharacterized protein n=1 Tax=Glossina pallidipes TaxID=7398 RepID=A0A1A9ZAI8_GLOPL
MREFHFFFVVINALWKLGYANDRPLLGKAAFHCMENGLDALRLCSASGRIKVSCWVIWFRHFKVKWDRSDHDSEAPTLGSLRSGCCKPKDEINLRLSSERKRNNSQAVIVSSTSLYAMNKRIKYEGTVLQTLSKLRSAGKFENGGRGLVAKIAYFFKSMYTYARCWSGKIVGEEGVVSAATLP